MNTLEFTFEQSPLMALEESLQPGQTLSGARLLAMSEEVSEEALEEFLELLEEKDVLLDITDLQIPGAVGLAAERLKLEQELVSQGLPVSQLDPNDTLRLYLEELAQIPSYGDPCLLAEQVSLSNRQADAPGNAHNRLVEQSLSRVVELAGEYAGKGVLLLDLVQDGSVGLWRAVETFCGEGADFQAYCDRRIRYCMARQVLLQARSVGAGQMLRTAMEDYRSVDEKLLAELGRNPEPEELAQALHMTLQQTLLLSQLVENTRQMGKTMEPEPQELPQEEDQAVEDTAYFQMRQRISELLSQLTPEDAQLISLRYGLEGGLPMKPAQVAARLGITPEQVVQREAAALSKLRETKE